MRYRFPATRALIVLSLLVVVAASGASATLWRVARGQELTAAPSAIGGPAAVRISNLVKSSDLILAGRVIAIDVEQAAPRAMVYTVTRLRVSQWYRGDLGGEAVIYVMGGSTADASVDVSEQAEFALGEDVLLFAQVGSNGHYELTGYQYGKFTIARDAARDTLVAQTVQLEPIDLTELVAEAGRVATAQGSPLRSTTVVAPGPPEQFERSPRANTIQPARRWELPTITWSFNPSMPAGAAGVVPTAAQLQAAATAGFAEWQRLGGGPAFTLVGQTLLRPGLVENCLPGSGKSCSQLDVDANNVIGWVKMPFPNLVGLASCFSFPQGGPFRTTTECDIGLSAELSGIPNSDGWAVNLPISPFAVDLATVLVHEQGHLLGLDHSSGRDTAGTDIPSTDCLFKNAIMYFSVNAGDVRRAHNMDDMKAYRILYPQPANFAPGTNTKLLLPAAQKSFPTQSC